MSQSKPILGVLSHVDPEIFMEHFQLRRINHLNDIDRNGIRVDAVLFGVGTDINPGMYGQTIGRYTQTPDVARDEFEQEVFKVTYQYKIPTIGICRGAQFQTVMLGGKLIQHINGHAGTRHDIKTDDGRVINVNSYHHQMMVPATRFIATKVLATTITPRSDVYYDGNNRDARHEHPLIVTEPEVIVYRDTLGTNHLAIQGHPEWEPPGSEFYNYTLELTEKYVINKEGV